MTEKVLMFLLFALVAASCSQDFSRQVQDGLILTFAIEPNSARVGDNTVKLSIADQDGKPVSPSQVRFHYYPFVQRDKDSLAAPDEVVRVIDASAEQDGSFTAGVHFEKPGPWKVTVKITQPERPEVIATFTVEVAGEPTQTASR